MARLKTAWDKLSMNERALFIKLGLLHGLTDLKDIKGYYNLYNNGGLEEILNKVNSSNVNFVQRLKDPNRKNIPDWESPTDRISTHKLSVGTDENGNHYIFPEVQEINGKLIDFTRPPYHRFAGEISAEMKGDTVRVPSIEEGIKFTETYKQYYPFNSGGSLLHKKSGEELRESQYLKLDDAANYQAYEDATNYFLNLGFGPELASKYAIYKVHNNMTFDAGLLPEVTVTALAWGNGDNTSRMENYLNALKSKRETILNIEQAAFNLNIRNATDKWGKGIGLGMTALAALPVASGAMAGMNALRASYPIATGLWDAYWAGDGIVRNLFGDSGVKKTIKLAKEGDTWGALKSGAGDALDLLGVTDIFSLGKKIINPLYRSAHAYNTIPQFGYLDTLGRFKNWSKTVLSGTDPNVMNEALWVEGLRKLLQMDNMSGMPYLSALADVNKDAAIEIAVRGRDEASRLYNHLPSRHLYYIPNGDGSYRYNLEKIQQDWKQLSGEEFFPLPTAEFYDEILATLGHHGWDVITGAGGNLTGNSFIDKVTVGDRYHDREEFGIKLIEDMLDAHPFRRNNRQFSDWLQKSVLDKTSEQIRNKANTLYTTLFDLTNKGLDYGSTKLNRFWYDYLGGRPLNKLRYETKLQLPGYIKEGVTRKPGPFWQKVNATMSDFEVGSLTGATPFLMRTEVPYTRTFQIASGKDIPYFVDDKIILGHHSDKHFIPSILDPYSIQRVDNFLQFNIPDFTNLKSTGGPLYPFSFKKNPFLKTPVVRYDEGGQKQDASNPGGYTDEQLNNNYLIWKTYDPTGGLNFFNYIASQNSGNLARGEENEYWKEYLGLDSAVPLMNSNAYTEWDKQIEAQKKQNGELTSDFYGTTPRMDYNILALADTLMLGNMVRNYAEYDKMYDLPHIETVTEAYEQAKNILNNPNQWTFVNGEIPIGGYRYDSKTSETNPLGMLSHFGMKWVPEENALYMHDTYDFPNKVYKFTDIPMRPREMKIRSKINFDPTIGSWLLRSPVNYNTEIPVNVTK